MQWDETEQYKKFKATADRLMAQRTKEEQEAYNKMIDDAVRNTKNMPRWKLKWLMLSANVFRVKIYIANLYKRLIKIMIKY